MAKSDLIQTGVYGLDELFLGGLRKGNIFLVVGATGTGKTTLGIEFIYRGITEFDQPGLIVMFENAPQKLMRDAEEFGWDLQSLQDDKKLTIIFTSPQVLHNELSSPDSLLLETAVNMGAHRVFIDGVSLLRALVPKENGANANGVALFREVLQQLIEGLNRENLTAMLTHEASSHQDDCREVAEFLADTVISLTSEHRQRSLHRGLEIVKSRGQDFDSGKHTLRITSGKGLQVFRRVQAPPRRMEAQPTSTAKRSIIGVEALDTLIGGGLFEGSTTMVVGVSGAGKTTLGMQLLLEGANKQGKRGLLVSFEEHPAQVLRNAETLGLNLRKLVDKGMIQLMYECPQELDIDTHFDDIKRNVEEHKVERLLIDGMSSYSNSIGEQAPYRDFFHALGAYSKDRLLTTFFNYENPELFGMTHYMPEFGVSSIVDNLIVLGLVELGSTLHRSIAVAKARGCPHNFETREFVIEQGGIRLLPLDESARLPALPFQSYYGLMSRAPTRISPLHGETSTRGTPFLAE